MEKTNEFSVESVCKDILFLINNSNTRIKIEQNAKNSYYVFLNDTIYLSERQTSIERKDTRLVLMCHECLHSIQSKLLQWINFIFSNLEMALFITAIVLKYLFKQEYIVPIYSLVALFSISIRLFLEVDASFKSIPLAKQYMNTYLSKGERADIDKIKKEMFLTFPVFLVSLFGFKLLRMIIIII